VCVCERDYIYFPPARSIISISQAWSSEQRHALRKLLLALSNSLRLFSPSAVHEQVDLAALRRTASQCMQEPTKGPNGPSKPRASSFARRGGEAAVQYEREGRDCYLWFHVNMSLAAQEASPPA